MAGPGYGTLNADYVGSWFSREGDGPMWALNLMKYKKVADYGPDYEGEAISGLEADNRYSPIDELASVGARPVLVAPVVHQLRGDETTWDRIAIALYPKRTAMIEMNQKPEFQKTHVHKEAGMDCTIVMATFPQESARPDPLLSAVGDDKRLLLQVVESREVPDLAAGVESIRLGVFDIEGVIIGDERSFAEARWDLISAETASKLAEDERVSDKGSYAVIIDPALDTLAESIDRRG